MIVERIENVFTVSNEVFEAWFCTRPQHVKQSYARALEELSAALMVRRGIVNDKFLSAWFSDGTEVVALWADAPLSQDPAVVAKLREAAPRWFRSHRQSWMPEATMLIVLPEIPGVAQRVHMVNRFPQTFS